jgi:hypothetical protein
VMNDGNLGMIGSCRTPITANGIRPASSANRPTTRLWPQHGADGGTATNMRSLSAS